jgi:hypothetical protein
MTAETSRLEMWTERAPWMVFGLAPLGLLAAAYGLCLFILWSGWRMLLPSEQTPFVPVDGWALFYFGAGRFLYFWAPMVVCCAIACIAARPGVKALWADGGNGADRCDRSDGTCAGKPAFSERARTREYGAHAVAPATCR